MTSAPFRIIRLALLVALSACVGDPTGSRVATLEYPNTRIEFDALGDTVTFHAKVVDGRGTAILGAQVEYSISNPAVATVVAQVEDEGSAGVGQGDVPGSPPAQLVSVSPGRTLLRVQDLNGAIVEQVVIDVDQAATTLRVVVDSGNPIVRLPEGAALPLVCQAFDKNGFEIPLDTILVRSVKGTVTRGGCADARVQRSGYDTLVFSLDAAEIRVPVIVATRPDSVGIVAAAQPLTTLERERFIGEDLANPSILALRPLVNEILVAYGNPTSNLDRARALRDWLARTAVHPHAALHPDGSTSNVGVLPPGTSWSDVNALYRRTYADSMFSANNAYWWGVGYDGYAMLDRLLGTLDQASGIRANDGMMVHVAGARYQIRDLETYRFPICSFQAVMLSTLWAAAGLHGMLASTWEHDPAAVFIPELSKWVYEDPTFNDEYTLDDTGDPLSPAELLALTSSGQVGRLHATKFAGPSFDPQAYIANDTYIGGGHPDGMVIMGSQLNNRVVGIGGWPTRQVQIDVPRLANYSPFNQPSAYSPVTAEVAFPILGAIVTSVRIDDSVYVIQLSSTFPNHQRFERRLSGGTWEGVTATDVLPIGQCRVEYRSLDAIGSVSASAVLDVWAPRTTGFVESGMPGGVRALAPSCISPRSL